MKTAAEKIAALRAIQVPAQDEVRVRLFQQNKPRIDMKKLQHRATESTAVEIRRIINMPRKMELSREEYEELSRHYLQAHVFNSPSDPFRRLFDTQAESLVAYNECNGAFLPLAVGGGKTLTSLLIANDAFMAGKKKIMLIIPPGLVEQLVGTDIKLCRKKTIFNIPVWNMSGIPAAKRKLLSKSGRQGLYVYTYSLLSSKDASDIMEAVSPDLVILDEAHSVMRASARTRRFNRYLREHKPQCVSLSGTMSQKELTEYFELACACLKEYNFLPNSRVMTAEWSKIIDTSAQSFSSFKDGDEPKAGPLSLVIDWARKHFPDEKDEHGRPMFAPSLTGMRQAFQKNIESCVGVVCSSGHQLPYSLYINNQPVKHPERYEGYELQQNLISKLKNEWVTPNGDELEEKMHLFRWLYWIEGAGFYNERYWPSNEWLIKHHKEASTDQEAELLLERSKEHLFYERSYMSSLRKWLNTRSRPHLDSPMLVGNSMHNHGAKHVGQALYDAWNAVKSADFEGRIVRHKRAIRVCGFKIEEAVRWAKELPKNEGGLIWYDNDEIGQWAKERFEEEGVDFLFCPAGKSYNELLTHPDKCRGKVILLTINAHFQGRNLQFDRNMFYLQWPRSAKMAEQSIGRQHRERQEYDEVNVTTCLTSEFDRVLYSATLHDAIYVHASLGNQQKIIYGKYLYQPEIVPYEVLHAWGVANIKELDAKGKAFLAERFGK